MRLLTWNIHKGIGGLDRRYRPERIAAVVHHYRPDVLVLQEVDDGVPRSRQDPQAEDLAARLGFAHVAYGANVVLSKGRYGNATLSHVPIVRHHNVRVTFPMKKPRGILYTELHVPVAGHVLTAHIFNMHLGLAGVERRWQVRRLLDHPLVRRLDRRSRIVLAGDTNDWAGALPAGRLAEAGFRCVTGTGRSAMRTFPAWGPVGALDRVFLRGPIEAEHLLRPRLELARVASDHRPVLVDLDLTR